MLEIIEVQQNKSSTKYSVTQLSVPLMFAAWILSVFAFLIKGTIMKGSIFTFLIRIWHSLGQPF